MGKWNKQSKYQNADYVDSILPDQVKIKRPLPEDVRIHRELPLVFVDPEYGEFITSIRGLVDAGKSTHPKLTGKRRAITNVAKPANEKQKTINKRFETMKQRGNGPGSEYQIIKKRKKSILNYGTNNPMQNDEVKEAFKNSILEKYGVENVMHLETTKNKLVETCIKRYGVTNGGGTASSIEKILQSHINNADTGSSKIERDVLAWVHSLNINANKGYIEGATPKELDIKINNNLAIEINGAYWHSDFFKKNNYHLEKTILAEKIGMKLIHIFDFEWTNRNAQVKSFLRSALGKNEITVFARKCDINTVPIAEARQFLEKYHILGAPTIIKFAYCLYYENQLVSVVTLGPHHRQKTSELILNRYCGKENVTVTGGLSKLTKHCVRSHGEIATWVDRRISNGVNWIKSGWEVINVLPPDYFYYDPKNKEVIGKQSRQKRKVNTPDKLTEREHAILDGLMRIWDCGKIKLIAK
jgi:hypothetical protein